MKDNFEIKEDKIGFEGKGKMDLPTLLYEHLSTLEAMYQAEANDLLGDIRWKQLQMLNYIDMCEKDPTLIYLANIIGTSYQNVARSLVTLERKGLVETISDKKDKRKVRVLLTGEGRKCIEKKNKTRDMFSNMAFSGITEEEIDTTLETILKIKANLIRLTAITVITQENKPIIARTFSYKKVYSGRSSKPHYLLYAFEGYGFPISDVNKWLIGAYENKEDLDLEIQGLKRAIQNHDKEYVIKQCSTETNSNTC